MEEYRSMILCSKSLNSGWSYIFSRLESSYILLTGISQILCSSHCIFSGNTQCPFIPFLVMLILITWLKGLDLATVVTILFSRGVRENKDISYPGKARVESHIFKIALYFKIALLLLS